MKRLFENENFIVVEKQAGWLTTPAREKTDARLCLGRLLQNELGSRIYPVHRLDFEVGGVVIFAKNPDAHRVAQKWFETGSIIKTYRAITIPGEKEPPREWVEWRSHLARGKRRAYESSNGKLSITRAKVIDENRERWIWKLQPLTGRPHQLRVELARHGTPILGDVLYGGPPGVSVDVISLSAIRLDLAQIPETERGGLPDQLSLD